MWLCLAAAALLTPSSSSRLDLMQGTQCTRWRKAGRNPGHVYWLRPGATFSNKSNVVFSGLHSLQQTVYYELPEPALAILVAKAAEDMVLSCQGRDAIQSLRVA